MARSIVRRKGCVGVALVLGALLGAPGAGPVTGAPAQLHAQSLSVGVKAGVNAARHLNRSDGWSEDIRTSTRYGPALGLGLVASLPWPVDLQVELLYSEKGGREPDGSWARLAYIEMPILARARIPEWERIPARLFLNAGIAPAREVDCSGEARPGAGPGGTAPLEPVACSEVRSYAGDLGLVVGGGGELEVRGWDTSLEIRYVHGTTDILTRFDHRERMNRSFSLIAGVSVPWSPGWWRW